MKSFLFFILITTKWSMCMLPGPLIQQTCHPLLKTIGKYQSPNDILRLEQEDDAYLAQDASLTNTTVKRFLDLAARGLYNKCRAYAARFPKIINLQDERDNSSALHAAVISFFFENNRDPKIITVLQVLGIDPTLTIHDKDRSFTALELFDYFAHLEQFSSPEWEQPINQFRRALCELAPIPITLPPVPEQEAEITYSRQTAALPLIEELPINQPEISPLPSAPVEIENKPAPQQPVVIDPPNNANAPASFMGKIKDFVLFGLAAVTGGLIFKFVHDRKRDKSPHKHDQEKALQGKDTDTKEEAV